MTTTKWSRNDPLLICSWLGNWRRCHVPDDEALKAASKAYSLATWQENKGSSVDIHDAMYSSLSNNNSNKNRTESKQNQWAERGNLDAFPAKRIERSKPNQRTVKRWNVSTERIHSWSLFWSSVFPSIGTWWRHSRTGWTRVLVS